MQPNSRWPPLLSIPVNQKLMHHWPWTLKLDHSIQLQWLSTQPQQQLHLHRHLNQLLNKWTFQAHGNLRLLLTWINLNLLLWVNLDLTHSSQSLNQCTTLLSSSILTKDTTTSTNHHPLKWIASIREVTTTKVATRTREGTKAKEVIRTTTNNSRSSCQISSHCTTITTGQATKNHWKTLITITKEVTKRRTNGKTGKLLLANR